MLRAVFSSACLLAGLLVCAAGLCGAEDALTPAVEWARPLDGGSVRALIVLPRAAARDAEELARRLDLDFDLCTVWDAGHLGCDPLAVENRIDEALPERTAERLADLLEKDYGVVVLGGFSLEILPEAILAALAAQVRTGTGLVLVHMAGEAGAPWEDALAEEADFPEATRGLGPLEPPSGSGLAPRTPDAPPAYPVRAACWDEGRVAEIRFPGGMPYTHALLPGLWGYTILPPDAIDNAYAMLARVLLWAAKREPEAAIRGIEDKSPQAPSDEEIPPDLPKEYTNAVRQPVMEHPQRPFAVALAGPAPRPLEVSVQVRRTGTDMRLAWNVGGAIAKGAERFPVDVYIGPGEFTVDVWLKDKGKVVDWFSQEVVVSGWPTFSNVRLSKESLLANDTLNVEVHVAPTFNPRRSCTLYARAMDPFGADRETPAPASLLNTVHMGSYAGLPGRIVAEATAALPHSGGEASLELPVAGLLAPLLKIELFLVEGAPRAFSAPELSRAFYAYRYVPVRIAAEEPQFRLVAEAPAPWEPNARYYLKQLRAAGVDMVSAPGSLEGLWNSADAGMGFLPELMRIEVEGAEDGVLRNPCLSDPAYRARVAEGLESAVASHGSGGAGYYSLGGQNTLCASEEEVCQSEACLERFREWLQVEYPDLRALNDTWGGGFNAWEEVHPPSRDIALEAECYAGWVDFRRFMDTVFADFHGMAAESVRRSDAAARVGFGVRPGDGPGTGYDWRLLADAADVVVTPLDRMRLAKLRSYAPGKHRAAISFGHDRPLTDPEVGQWLPWYAVLQGASELWCRAPYAGTAEGRSWTALGVDGSFSPGFEALCGAMGVLNNGLGGLFLRAERPAADVALYDSPVSRYVNALDPRYGMTSEEAEAAWAAWLEDQGLSYDVVGSKEAYGGRLSRCRVLILPLARALSDEEVRALRAFRESGGWLLADGMPGVWGGHGERRELPALDALFGASRGGAAETMQANGGVDASLAPQGAEAVNGGQETFLDFLTPRTLLLNHPPAGGNLYHWETRAKAFLDAAGCMPVCAVEAPKKQPFQGARYVFNYGSARVVALLASPEAAGKKQKLSLSFDKDASVYDALRGEQLSGPKRVNVELSPGEAACFGVFPAPVEGVVAEVMGEAAAGRRLNVSAGVLSEGKHGARHLVRVYLEDPAGRRMAHYDRLVECVGRPAPLFFTLAKNEIPGWYTVVAREALTGIEARTRVFVSGVTIGSAGR